MRIYIIILFTIGIPFSILARQVSEKDVVGIFAPKTIKCPPFQISTKAKIGDMITSELAEKIGSAYRNVLKSYHAEYGLIWENSANVNTYFTVIGRLITRGEAVAEFNEGDLAKLMKWNDDYYLSIEHFSGESISPFQAICEPLSKFKDLTHHELISLFNSETTIYGIKNYEHKGFNKVQQKNKVEYPNSISITEIIECENCPDVEMGENITALIELSLNKTQGRRIGLTFFDYNLYLPNDKISRREKNNYVFKGHITYDSLYQEYKIKLSLHKDGIDITIGEAYGKNKPIILSHEERYDFYKSVLPITNKAFTIVFNEFYYSPEEKEGPGDPLDYLMETKN